MQSGASPPVSTLSAMIVLLMLTWAPAVARPPPSPIPLRSESAVLPAMVTLFNRIVSASEAIPPPGAVRLGHVPSVAGAATIPGVRIGGVAGDDARADRRSVQIEDASAVCRCRVVDHRGARDGAAPEEDPAAVRLRNVGAHDAVRDR